MEKSNEKKKKTLNERIRFRLNVLVFEKMRPKQQKISMGMGGVTNTYLAKSCKININRLISMLMIGTGIKIIIMTIMNSNMIGKEKKSSFHVRLPSNAMCRLPHYK